MRVRYKVEVCESKKDSKSGKRSGREGESERASERDKFGEDIVISLQQCLRVCEGRREKRQESEREI